MLEVQKYLAGGKTLDDLTAELGIKVQRHETLPIAILNYDQIESPKTHGVARNCRGLVLRTDTHEVVGKSFDRFFNWGEVADEMPMFDFSDFIVQSKEDGSLVLLYNFQGQWMANTRGSFGKFKMDHQDFTWEEAFCKALNIQSLNDLNLDPAITYVCEFCSPYNKIVRRYEKPVMYLLTAFKGTQELHHKEVDLLVREPLLRPNKYEFKSIEEITDFIKVQETTDPTFEGVVICDKDGRRWKCKSSTYLALHRLGSCKESLFAPKNLLPFILAGEGDELLTYFGEVKEHYEKLEKQINDYFTEMEKVWLECKDIQSQKDFALAIQGKTPFTSLLFRIRKTGSADLRQEWKKSEDMILKHISK